MLKTSTGNYTVYCNKIHHKNHLVTLSFDLTLYLHFFPIQLYKQVILRNLRKKMIKTTGKRLTVHFFQKPIKTKNTSNITKHNFENAME